MKKLLAGFALFGFAAGISAQTVINFDDGSTYTLADGEEIFISKNTTLFTRRILNNKDTFLLLKILGHLEITYQSHKIRFEPGSHEWCKTYVPWSEGLTFDMILWQRACDTDNDGKYGCGDTNFDASADGGVLLFLNNGDYGPLPKPGIERAQAYRKDAIHKRRTL